MEKPEKDKEFETTDFIIKEIDKDTVSFIIKGPYTVKKYEDSQESPIESLKIGGFLIHVGQDIKGSVIKEIKETAPNIYTIYSSEEQFKLN